MTHVLGGLLKTAMERPGIYLQTCWMFFQRRRAHPEVHIDSTCYLKVYVVASDFTGEQVWRVSSHDFNCWSLWQKV